MTNEMIPYTYKQLAADGEALARQLAEQRGWNYQVLTELAYARDIVVPEMLEELRTWTARYNIAPTEYREEAERSVRKAALELETTKLRLGLSMQDTPHRVLDDKIKDEIEQVRKKVSNMSIEDLLKLGDTA